MRPGCVGSGSVRINSNADAWSINEPFTDEQQAHVEAEADLFYTDFIERVAEGRKMSIADVDAIACGWVSPEASLVRSPGRLPGRAVRRTVSNRAAIT